jgi:hypothetical protein
VAAFVASVACAAAPGHGGESEPLGCHDVGIYGDLDAHVALALPTGLTRKRLSAIVDPAHATLVLYDGGWPVKVYPIGAGDKTHLGDLTVKLRADDAAELTPLLDGRPVAALGKKQHLPPGDRDRDGIPDPLDVLVGGKKLVVNGAHYTGDYFVIGYPGGDAPRDKGSCADVVVRALRNAGVDLQKLVADDIAAAPRAYPTVRKVDHNIDHRRVRNLRVWFARHGERHGVDPADAKDPFRPGDVLFLDTIASKKGPDHVGIVSDVIGPSGLPLVINNWTDGYQDSEMDLLPAVPVTDRFRLAPE